MSSSLIVLLSVYLSVCVFGVLLFRVLGLCFPLFGSHGDVLCFLFVGSFIALLASLSGRVRVLFTYPKKQISRFHFISHFFHGYVKLI